MSEKKQKRVIVNFKTPTMTLVWPKLDKPDYGTKDYPNPEGRYSTKAVGELSDPAVQDLIAKLRPLHDEAVLAAREQFQNLKAETRKKLKDIQVNEFYTELLDETTEQPTGEVEFNFKMAASGEVKQGPKAGKKWTAKPAVFDAKGAPIETVPQLWGGTTAMIAFSVVKGGYFIPGTGACGISLKLEGVQLINPVFGGQKTASALGFGAEDGYTHTETAAAAVDQQAGEDAADDAAAADHEDF